MSLDARPGYAADASGGLAPPGGPAPSNGLPWTRLSGAWQALGPVLCLHPTRHWPRQPPPPAAPWPLQAALLGLLCASRARLDVELDSEGPCEWIAFLDPAGRPVFALGLLPDSDLLAWERLVATLGLAAMQAESWRFRCERWRSSGRSDWQGACARLTESDRTASGTGRIGLSATVVSVHGLRCARRLARRFGAPADQ